MGGKKAELGQYPWLVNIGYSVPGGGVEYKCGGSLIGPRHILTAAHCVAGLPKSYNLYVSYCQTPAIAQIPAATRS